MEHPNEAQMEFIKGVNNGVDLHNPVYSASEIGIEPPQPMESRIFSFSKQIELPTPISGS